MLRARNDDSPPLRKVDTSRRFGSPQKWSQRYGQRVSSNPEVMTNAFSSKERPSVVTTISDSRSGLSIYSKKFESRFKNDCANIKEFYDHVVVVSSFYSVQPSNEAESPTVTHDSTHASVHEEEGGLCSTGVDNIPFPIVGTYLYSGSGLLVEKNGKVFVITARHNVLSERRSAALDKKYEEAVSNINGTPKPKPDLKLEEIRISFPGSNLEEKFRYAQRYHHPNVPTSDRPPHIVKEEELGLLPDYWKYNSDFAFLLVSGENENTTPCPLVPLKISEFDFFDFSKDDSLFVYGIPCALTEKDFRDEYPRSTHTYQDYCETYRPDSVNVSYGNLTQIHESLHGYNANTAPGMSGGPVFLCKQTQFKPVGLHVGGREQLDCNYYVPFSMPAFQEAWNAL